MNDETIKEIAATAGKGIEASQQMGTFIGRFVSGPMEQISGIWEDKLKYRRWENQLALMIKAQKKLQDLAIAPNRPIPMKAAIPLLEYASVEDDDSLQELWGNLLVNFSNAQSGVSLELAYVEILKSISPLEARILQVVYSLPLEKSMHNRVSTYKLPESAHTFPEKMTEKDETPEPAMNICLALANLDRLGCLNLGRTWGGGQSFTHINTTHLGHHFVQACTLKT